MQKITLYQCKICNTQLDQISHHKSHIKTSKHKTNRELFRYKCLELSETELIDKYNCNDIEKIINVMENNEILTKKNLKYNILDTDLQIMTDLSEQTNNISNREDLKDKIHELHNFLRNNGAGYGMNALKVFNILYGLKRLEERGLYSDIGFTNKEHHFSNLLKLANEGKDEELTILILGDDELLDSINVSKVKDLLMYEIPKKIKGNVFSSLVKEIEKITKIEKECNVQLSGKIYEYFIGRDESAISELGAYFTDRHIVNYIFGKLDIQLEEDGSIGTMIDPFGGSGGFTTGFINYINERYPEIDWKTQIDKIYHFDMNEDVIKSAGLEFFLLTGILPNMEKNLGYKNSFADEFLDERYKYVITNPPYGGDKNKKSGKVEKRDKVKKHLDKLLKNTELGIEMKERYEKQLLSIKAEERRESKEKEKDKVTLSSSSKQINRFAKQHKLKGGDKEAVSLIQIMDMVAEGGLGCGVLKEGVFFNKTYKEHRRVLVENYDVECVISVPSSEFENTSTKTSIVIFRNNGKPTGSVKFYNMEITRYEEDKFEERDGFIVLAENEGDIKSVGDVLVSEATREQILANDIYSLNGKDYNKREIIPGEGYEMVNLEDICYCKGGCQLSKKNYIEGDYPVIGGGLSPSGYHHKYNMIPHTILCSQSGNNAGFISRYSKSVWASDCFGIIPKKKTDNNYLYYILKIYQDYIFSLRNGSAQPHLYWKDLIKHIQIPVPTDPQLLIQWVDKISAPFDESHTKSARIKELEGQVADRIREITENEECEEVELGAICEIKSGCAINKKDRNGINYPYYAANGISGFVDTYLFDGKFIICAQDGSIGATHLVNGKFYASNHVWVLNNIVYCDINYMSEYIYNILKHFVNYSLITTGSVIPKITKEKMIHIKLKIPKDKTLITNLDPTFAEIERLQDEVKQADTLYHQYIDELAKEAIVGETIVSAPIKTKNENVVSTSPIQSPIQSPITPLLDTSNEDIERLQHMTADPLPLAPGEWQGQLNITEAELKKKNKSQLQELIRTHHIPNGRGSGFSISSANKTKLIAHILTHLPSSLSV